jgi:hypothetical protein
MNGRLAWVSPLHVGLVSAFTGFVLGYLVVGLLVIENQLSSKPSAFNYLNGLVLVPLGVSFGAFVVAGLGALLYNAVAKRGMRISARVEPGAVSVPEIASESGAPLRPRSDAARMRVRYDFGYLDYLSFCLVQQFLSPILQGAVLGFVGYIFVSELKERPLGASLLMAFFWYVMMWVGQIVLLAIYLFGRRRDTVMTDHDLEIRDDALYESTVYNEARFLWSGIQRLVDRPGFVAVYVSRHSAHVIPARAFESGEQRARFVALVREKMRSVARD